MTRMKWPGAASGSLAAAALLVVAATVHADTPLPPWVGEGDIPLAGWARSVAPRPGQGNRPGDMVLFAGPNGGSGPRGVTAPGATLPIFGARHGAGCTGSW